MIAYLEGTLLEQWGNSCIVKTPGGIGYRVAVPSHTMAELPEKGGAVALYTSFIVREDAQELYGFKSFSERQTFEALVTISKVGAKTALAVLSVFTPDDLQRIVLDDDPLVLTQVPGIGKKTAQHVFLELKDKLKMVGEGIAGSGAGGSVGSPLLRNVLDGLFGLGYQEAEVYPIVRKLLEENPTFDVSQALRASLQALSKESRGKK